jgi:hypothetical protein
MLVDNLTKLSRSSRNAVSASLILIAALAMYSWIVAPRTKYLSAAQHYELVMDNMVKKNKTIENRVNIKKKKLQELQEQSAQLQSTLFTSNQAREFFSDLQAISEQTGCIVYSVNLITYNPNPIKDRQLQDSAGIVTKSAVLSVVGVYKNITNLINRLQSRTQKVWIDSVKVQALNNNSDRPRCDITITICALTDKEPAL